jgi:hypothetical protein
MPAFRGFVLPARALQAANSTFSAICDRSGSYLTAFSINP